MHIPLPEASLALVEASSLQDIWCWLLKCSRVVLSIVSGGPSVT